jgi:general secretion pathway protein C
MEIYRNLGQTTSASLEIERDGEIVTVDVELE